MSAGVASSAPAATASAPSSAAKPAPTRLVISAVGDCTLGGDPRGSLVTPFDVEAARHAGDPTWPFTGVHSLTSTDDLTIANLEGTLTTEPEPRPDGAFRFRGKPAYARMLAAGGIDVVSTSNNHTFDFGNAGYLATVSALTRAGVGVAGEREVFRRQVRGVEIVVLAPAAGADAAGRRRVVAAISAVARLDNILVVYFHWGIEYSPQVHPYQRELGRAAIDAGADLVLGSHPHVLQGIELYRGRHIVYSLGNFSFGGNTQPRERDTMIHQEIFTLDPAGIRAVESRIVPASVTSSPERNDFRPQLLEGEAAARVLARVRDASDELARTRDDELER